MSDYVVWLDSSSAHIFNLKSTGIEKSTVKKSSVDHHTQNKKDQHRDAHEEHFFHDLSVRLKDSGKLLILGPGLAKKHFRTYLEEHHASEVAKKIIGLENCDHPTDNQILATARKFFVKYDLFNSPIN